jgi:hypothetical protein
MNTKERKNEEKGNEKTKTKPEKDKMNSQINVYSNSSTHDDNKLYCIV